MRERVTEFTTLIPLAYKKLQQIKKQQSAAYDVYDIKGVHVMCLYHLGRHAGGLTVTELASLCCEDKAATSRTVEYLVERGYVVHEKAQSRKRWRSKVQLTDSGQALCKVVDNIASQASAVITSGIPEKDVQIFYDVLNQMIANMDKFQDEEN